MREREQSQLSFADTVVAKMGGKRTAALLDALDASIDWESLAQSKGSGVFDGPYTYQRLPTPLSRLLIDGSARDSRVRAVERPSLHVRQSVQVVISVILILGRANGILLPRSI